MFSDVFLETGAYINLISNITVVLNEIAIQHINLIKLG